MAEEGLTSSSTTLYIIYENNQNVLEIHSLFCIFLLIKHVAKLEWERR